jgi:glycerol-3-phosphate cytidylyltransferase
MDASEIARFRADHVNLRIGVTASCFDLMHAGHVLMLKEAKSMVDAMVVFLQTDPTVDRPSKNKPILSMEERRIVVEGCRYVDYIFEYTTEAELLEGLRALRPDLRVLGDDYVGKAFTGSELDIPVHFHNRSVHGWSTSALRRKICEEGKRASAVEPSSS